MDSGVLDFDGVFGSQTTNLSSEGTGTFTASAINHFISIVRDAEDLHLSGIAGGAFQKQSPLALG